MKQKNNENISNNIVNEIDNLPLGAIFGFIVTAWVIGCLIANLLGWL